MPSSAGGTSWLYHRATATPPPASPHSTQRFSFQINRLVASFGKKFMVQAIKIQVDAINPGLRVELAPVGDVEEKCFVNICVDDQVGSVISQEDFQQAEDTVRRLLDAITIDEPIDLPGIQPEALRDSSELKDLAVREEVFYHITNLSKSPNAIGPGFKTSAISPSMFSAAKIDSPYKNQRSTIMPEFFGDNIAEIKDFLRCAETLRHYILSTGSDLQPIHMAAYYEQYPEMRAILKNPSFKLKDFCRAFPHLLHMKVDKDKKGRFYAIY